MTKATPLDSSLDSTLKPAPGAGDGRGAAPSPAREVDPDEARARAAFDRARAGQRGDFGVVVRVYQDRLYNAVYRLVSDPDDAAEVVQEAFARGFEKMADFRGDSGPYTWLFRIAMNAAVSRLRKGKRRKTVSLDALDSMGGGYATSFGRAAVAAPTESAERSEDHNAVIEALGKLDAENRALLVMRDLEGFDYKQMAEILGLPLGTLKSRLFRARAALREHLRGHFDRQQGGEAG